MLKKMKRASLGIITATMILGSSLTVFAGNCLTGDHSFSVVTKSYTHRTLDSYHTHYDSNTGLTYSCTSYKYYYNVLQRCSGCGTEITMQTNEVKHFAN